MPNESTNLINAIADSTPSLKKKLIIWAVRSAIALAIAYGVVAMNGPAWLIPAAWIYVGVSLVTSVGFALYARKRLAEAQARAQAHSEDMSD